MQPQYRPSSSDAPAAAELMQLPASRPGRQGIVAYAGRQLPLPAGSWQELAVARATDGQQEQVTLLDRVENGHLTGLMLVAAPGPLSGAVGPVGLPPFCSDPGRIGGYVVPELPGQSPLVHECWSIATIDMQIQSTQSPRIIIQRGLQRLAELHVAVPNHMLMTDYLRSDETGWLEATIILRDPHDGGRRVAAWMNRFAAALHKGYDHTLALAELPTGSP